jgi:tetratricopeptide (TPR) repeat protein
MDCLRNVSQRVNNLLFQLSLVAIIAACLFFSSCNRERDVKSTLADVETYIDEYPDSALRVINSIDTNAVRGRSVKAKYALLKSIALDKNYIDTTDTRIIAPAVEYYKHHGSEDSKAKSFYYLGRVQQNAKDYNLAIVSFTEAEESAEKALDNKYVGLSCRNISHIANETYQYREELKYAEKEEKAFRKYGDYGYHSHSKMDLAIACNNNMDFARSQQLYQEIIDTAKVMKDTTLMAGCLRYYAAQLIEGTVKDYEKGIHMMEYVSDTLFYPLTAADYGILARAYSQIGDINETDKCLDSADRYLPYYPEDERSLNTNKYYVSKTKGDNENTIVFLENTVSLQDSVIRGLFSKTTSEAQNEYYQNKSELNSIKAEKRSLEINIVVLTFVFILIMLIIYYKYRRAKLQGEIETQRAALEEIKVVGNEEICHLIKSRLGLVQDVQMKYYGNKNLSRQKEQVHKGVIEIVHQLESAEEERILEDLINRHFDNVMVLLRQRFHYFTETDFRLLAYDIVGLKPSVTSIFIEKRIDWVYNRKAKLLSEIKKDSFFAEKYDDIIIRM